MELGISTTLESPESKRLDEVLYSSVRRAYC